MKQLAAWLYSISPAHLLVMVVLGVLLGLGIGPQETELVVLVGAAGLAIPTGSTTPTTTTSTTTAATAKVWPTAPTATTSPPA